MKATSLLEAQHRTVEALFEKLESRRGNMSSTLDELANNLVAHMAIEQDILYPAIREVDEELVNESYEEHALAEVALRRLLATHPDEPVFKARLTALKELIEHHVTEEEEELFPQVEEALDDAVLTRLAKAMKPRFDEVYETGFARVTPEDISKTTADLARTVLERRDAENDKPVVV
jgi:iron-sulfur cluster repair protein YtfE (RIC family)